jgi:hypothetical protein
MKVRNRYEREINSLPNPYFSGENEIDVKFGKTLYLPIKLSKTVLPKVGVFIPNGFQPATAIRNSQVFSAIDVIVYFHGHIYPCDTKGVGKFDKEGIEYYWNTPNFTFLREELALSGRNALLIAPTFTNKLNRDSNTFGNLDQDNKFDFLINECLSNLKNKNFIPKDSQARNIILAGHSAGGLPMQLILWAKNSLGRNIVECWGFESLYFGTDNWWCWLNHNADKDFIHYRRESMFKVPAATLKRHNNFRDVSDGKSHCGIVKEKWRKSIENCRWLQMSKPSGSPANREVSDSYGKIGYQNVTDAEFSVEEVELYKGKIPVAGIPRDKTQRKKAKESGKPYVEIVESPSVFLPEIIRMAKNQALKDKKNDVAAKLNPDSWFSEFTRDLTFLGRSLKSRKVRKGKTFEIEYQYVHLEMAIMLNAAEKEFIRILGGSDAKKTGDILLNNSKEGISGSRKTSSTATFSMHMFGLAVDVNYLGNPYVESENDIKYLNDVLKNAGLLMNSQIMIYEKLKTGKFKDRYDYVKALDTVLENYFGLLDKPTELQQYVQTTPSSVWRGLALTDAKALIERNLKNLAGVLARKDYKDYFKKHAILDFDKRFVVGMETMGFDWGGYYGDMMHFDMRKTGVGYYIEKARKDYSAKVKSQAERLLKEKKYGAHSPD